MVEFSSDSRMLLTVQDSVFRAWTAAGEAIWEEAEPSHHSPVAAFSPGGRRIAVACYAHGVRIFDPYKAEMLYQFAGPEPLVQSVAFSPDGAGLVVTDSEGNVVVWEEGE